MEMRVMDIFAKANSDPQLLQVLNTVSQYKIGTTAGGRTILGYADLHHAATGFIAINPYFTAVRLDTAGQITCGHVDTKTLTNTLYHEARHTYQGALSAMPDALGTVNGNDVDQDYLVNNVPVPPTTILLDSATIRNVCNEFDGINGNSQPATYKGDSIADPYGTLPDGTLDVHHCPECNYVWYALEEDAHAFAASKTGP
jgi:hypothetical protein